MYGKTGTAQDNVDAWFCGYTQEISTCVWVGYPKEQTPLLYVEGVPAVYGGTIPAAIWHDYMLAAMDSSTRRQATYEMPELTGTRGPSVPVASPTPPPSPTVTPSPSTEPTPTDEPSPTDDPSPTETPSPTVEPKAFLQATIVPPENDRPTLGRHRQLTDRHAPKR